ncbi:MAG TPA: hypothetical protein VFX39_00670 [Gemmatimonadaceae bacterium]|nr:hypothetical protein [Gemmatimonadaceae bacterium]
MIVANLRRSLERNDAQLALRLIARGSDRELDGLEGVLRDEGVDAILDDPRLLDALLETPRGAHASLPLFAYVVIRNALRALGERDRELADYLASLVVHFASRDRAYRVGMADDEVYDSLVALLADVNGPDARRTLLVRAHLGNLALWLSGLFPDYIEHRRWRRGGPDLDYYEELGRRGFRLAADHRLAAEHGIDLLFATVADRFPLLRHALNDVSDRLLFPGSHTPERLLRQVRSAMMVRWER